MSDIEIARKAKKQNIKNIATKLDLKKMIYVLMDIILLK